LRMDGARPTSRALQARLAAFWWPDSQVLYAGATDRSIGGRAAALLAHVPGDRQPHADGQWLHLLRGLDRLGIRIWWAQTNAPEEYLDAVLDAFGEGRIAPPSRPVGALALPWANTRRPTGERQAHGITGSILPEPPRAPEPPRRIVELAPGDADGARPGETGSGMTRLTRPVVALRTKPAREHGDLKENAEYHAAREEQSFVEGRIQALEDRLRRAVVVDESASGRVVIGSTVKVEIGGEELTYSIV